MFKKAKVLYYIEKIDQGIINDIYNLIKSLKVKKEITIIPDLKAYNENDNNNFVNLNNFLLPGTIIAQNYQFDEDFCFFCLPANSLHLSLPIKPGELIWYFEDNEINEIPKNVLDNYPLLGIKYYWTSRIIGSRISEDLNYSLKENDFLITKVNYKKSNALYDIENTKVLDKKENKVFSKQISNKIILPDYKIPKLLTEIKQQDQLISSDILYEKNKNINFIPAAVPRYFPKSHELTLQGSNNSLINLTTEETNNKSQIDFVVGRHYGKDYRPFVLNSDFLFLNNIEISNSKFETPPINTVEIDLQKGFNVFFNNQGDQVLFKNPDYYLGEDFIDDNELESVVDYTYDASRILINEESDANVYFRSNSLSLNKIINTFDFQKQEKNILDIVNVKSINDYNKNDFEFLNDYFERIEFFDDILKPNILIKSNDIRIVSRMKLENKINETINGPLKLDSGSLMLIKEGNKCLDDSFISLEKNGDIFIDGQILYLGNFNKEILRQKIKSEDDILFKQDENDTSDFNIQSNIVLDKNELNSFFDITSDEADKMIGNGMGVVLGYNQKYSEPLVLGNSLVVILKNLIDTNIALINEVKKLSDDLTSHIHLGVTPGSGISGPVQNPVPYTTYSSTGQQQLNDNLNEIKNNLKHILSKFAKTS